MISLIKDKSNHVQSEIENYLFRWLNDKYIVFTSKINYNSYENNIESLIFHEKVLINEAK